MQTSCSAAITSLARGRVTVLVHEFRGKKVNQPWFPFDLFKQGWMDSGHKYLTPFQCNCVTFQETCCYFLGKPGLGRSSSGTYSPLQEAAKEGGQQVELTISSTSWTSTSPCSPARAKKLELENWEELKTWCQILCSMRLQSSLKFVPSGPDFLEKYHQR